MAPRIVLVTGCSSGIGLATAERLGRDHDQRFVVIATIISMAEKGDLVAAVGDTLDKTVFIKEMDITNDEHINAVVDDVMKVHGRIDIVLNIAGTGAHSYIDTMPRSQIELIFNINTIGIIRLTQAVLPHMKRQKAGKIITVTSYVGRLSTTFLEIYCASKFAIEGFFESLAPVARQSNIWISMVEPDFVKTGLKDVLVSSFEKIEADESVNDIDRSCARVRVKGSKGDEGILLPSDVVDTILKCIDAEKPVLRYQVPEDLAEHFATILADSTGERAVALKMKTIMTD